MPQRKPLPPPEPPPSDRSLLSVSPYRIEAIPSVPLQQAIPPGAGLRAQTWEDKLRQARDHVGRVIAPLFGMNFDQMAEDEKNGLLRQIMVYHGSPHVFEKFDVSKVGTGEGAQVYGHGLYFAENPETARAYQEALTAGSSHVTPEQLRQYYAPGDIIPSHGGGYDRVLEYREGAGGWNVKVQSVKRQGSEWVNDPRYPQPRIHATPPSASQLEAKLGIPAEPRGAFYEADLPDEHVAKMLHWDKPFSQQTPEVQKALQSLGYDGNKYYIGNRQFFNRAEAEQYARGADIHVSEPDTQIGKDFYRSLSERHGGAEAASKTLQDAGVPGIRYLDQGSRASGEGTHNVVLFNPDILRTVTRR